MRVAAGCVEPLVLRLGRHTRTLLRELRHGVEHVLDEGPLSWLSTSVAMDVVLAVLAVVPALGLVRAVSSSE
jgi:hypothetical protein